MNRGRGAREIEFKMIEGAEERRREKERGELPPQMKPPFSTFPDFSSFS
jgi:hypothetical protein